MRSRVGAFVDRWLASFLFRRAFSGRTWRDEFYAAAGVVDGAAVVSVAGSGFRRRVPSKIAPMA